MRQKFTQEQNEAFYLAAAKMFQETFGANNCISPSGQVVKEVFFPAYRDRFGTAWGSSRPKKKQSACETASPSSSRPGSWRRWSANRQRPRFEQIMSKVISEFEPFRYERYPECDIKRSRNNSTNKQFKAEFVLKVLRSLQKLERINSEANITVVDALGGGPTPCCTVIERSGNRLAPCKMTHNDKCRKQF
ncbi:Hypothetical_protein [Hexamita inflata]|uniref:Hypothetical_protein n=1 Tax=Hexamita inflata TaxID=28002 RepID=A0AA86PXY1_9EUKA|nr:Hypothetical protein HINF_LOCUS33488 [Hexamita inflata]